MTYILPQRSSILSAAVAAGLVAAAFAPAQAQTLDSLYQAAKAAGEKDVVVYGAPSATLRAEFLKAWGARFPDVTLSYTGMSGSQTATKLKAEAQAGVHAVDAIINGTTTGVQILKPNKMVRPFDDLVVVPDARDGKNWLGGGLAWADDERVILAMLAIVTPAGAVNTDLVKPGEIKGDMDLLNPKWKGKIISNDPRVTGSADLVYRRLYDLHGEDYLRKLAVDQQVVFTRNLRQAVDMMVKGQYAVVLGASPSELNAFRSKGIKNIGIDINNDWGGGKRVTSAGFGGLAVPVTVPHPNASKLFVNWLLTKEGQVALSRGLEYPSRRLDADIPEVPAYLKQKPGQEYFAGYTDDYLTHPDHHKMREYMKAIIK